jgi:hypothetical protein
MLFTEGRSLGFLIFGFDVVQLLLGIVTTATRASNAKKKLLLPSWSTRGLEISLWKKMQ